jgi:hypothetical protein
MKLTVTSSQGLLGRLANDIRDATRRGRIKTGHETEADWKQRVPVRTGRYRDSIRTDEEPQPGVTLVGTDVTPYPYLLEVGTRYMRARPSAAGAAEFARRRLVQNIADEIAKVTR